MVLRTTDDGRRTTDYGHGPRTAAYCVDVARVVVFPASRSFQFRMVLKPRK
jgi:hypothetical protein